MDNFKQKPLVYIASPYTEGDKGHNARASVRMFEILRKTGLVAPICPLFPHFAGDLVDSEGYEEWLDLDFQMLSRCDAIYVIDFVAYLSGSELYLQTESKGRDREIDFAWKKLIPVFGRLSQLLQWAKEQS